MSLQVVLLIGDNSERLQSLQSLIEQDGLIQVETLKELCGLEAALEQHLPDLVLLDTEALSNLLLIRQKKQQAEASQTIDISTESALSPYLFTNQDVGDEVKNLCAKVRDSQVTIPSLEHRPIMIVLSGYDDEHRRIEYFVSGADDILNNTMGEDEVRVRLLAHLRRNLDLFSNRITQLPGLVVLSRIVQRRLNVQAPWALLMVQLSDFDAYEQTYGQTPAQQLLRHFSLTLSGQLHPPEWAGHLDGGRFLVATRPEKAELLAEQLAEQFDASRSTYFTDEDLERGYIIAIEQDVSRRVPLMALGIGNVSHQSARFESFKAVFNTAEHHMREALQLVQQGATSQSHVVTAHQQLGGSTSEPVMVRKPLPAALIVESDAAMAYLLKTTLEMQGLVVESCTSESEAVNLNQRLNPRLIVMDSLINGETKGWSLCERLKAEAATKTQQPPKVVFISTVHDREKALSAGADLYFSKPFDLLPFLTWVRELTEA